MITVTFKHIWHGFWKEEKGPSLAPPFTSLNKIGVLSKYPDFCQLSRIEKFERFDENSAEKNLIPKSRMG